MIDSSEHAINFVFSPFSISKLTQWVFIFNLLSVRSALASFLFNQNLLSSVMSSAGSCSTKKSSTKSSKKSRCSFTVSGESDQFETNCDESFTLSGSKPPKTVGPLSKRHDLFAKYAPCGHWSTCEKKGCAKKKYFDACNTCPNRGANHEFLAWNKNRSQCRNWRDLISIVTAPFGPFGPWKKTGPAQFISPKKSFLKIFFPSPKCQRPKQQPMGRMAPWPLSGSCRFAGRPYGPCRPFGSFRSRGPFGAWTCKSWPTSWRPKTPMQPCWQPKKGGNRPCTPCHRPLFRPCAPCFVES